jgi:hypothetical protein
MLMTRKKYEVFVNMNVAQFERYWNNANPSEKTDVTVTVDLPAGIDQRIWYLAARPADRRASFSGSMLPFPAETMAFHGTPNAGTLRTSDAATIKFAYPNAYYARTELVPPVLYVLYSVNGRKEIVSLRLNSTPYRDIAFPEQRTSPLFYATECPVRDQYRVLLDSAYPTSRTFSTHTSTPAEFWSLKPAR